MTRCPSLSLSGLRPMWLPASLLTALLAVLLTVPLAVPVAAAAIESPRGAVQTPDLESLRPRAEEYWRLLISGDRAGASQFLRPEDRPAFLLGQKEPLRDPAIESIELSDDGAQATVEIAIDVITPFGVLPLKIRQEWIAVDGEWMTNGREEWMTEGLDTSGNPFRSSAPNPQ